MGVYQRSRGHNIQDIWKPLRYSIWGINHNQGHRHQLWGRFLWVYSFGQSLLYSPKFLPSLNGLGVKTLIKPLPG